MKPGAVDSASWYAVADVDSLPSPALLIFRQRLEQNIARMLTLAGGPEKLRPHLKTHKMREVIELQLARGITKFKCATIAEAELAAAAGVTDLLLAYQPVGPAVHRIVRLIERFPRTTFSVLGDDVETMRHLSNVMAQSKMRLGAEALEVLVDLDAGQHRTGIAPGPAAFELYRVISSLPGLRPAGLHAYDGHITDPNPVNRRTAWTSAMEPVDRLKRELIEAGLPVPRVVAGGTPTFPLHAQRGDVECGPGTCVFWDAGYAAKFPEFGFNVAALLLTRVVSKPSPGRVCLDLGHKALGSEMPPPRAVLLGLEDARPLVHSEEHLVVETPQSEKYKVGDPIYAIPWHICPTVALHASAVVIENGVSATAWKVAARDRCLTI